MISLYVGQSRTKNDFRGGPAPARGMLTLSRLTCMRYSPGEEEGHVLLPGESSYCRALNCSL